MKIGVITHWWCFENYGQLLQCYAFQQFLRKNGHEPFLIKWYPGETFASVYSKIGRFRRVMQKLLNPYALLKRFSIAETRLRKRRNRITPIRDFDSFRDNYLTFSEGVYCHLSEMIGNPAIKADLYSVGSDVVWKYFPLTEDGKIPFLQFAPVDVPCISYSPSFGTSVLKPEVKRFITPLLGRFNAVSVREPSGVALCREMGRNDAVCVLDPVFLLDRNDYEALFAVSKHREGVFSYLLKMQSRYPIKETRSLFPSERFAITTVYDDMGLPARDLADLTVPQWVQSIGSSRFVVTNSFHGTSMCIILHTPFAVILRDGGNGMDNRLTSILERVGLSNRIYRRPGDLTRMRDIPIDWVEVDRRLREAKKVSIRYLQSVGLVT